MKYIIIIILIISFGNIYSQIKLSNNSYFRDEKGNTTYIYSSGDYFYFRNYKGNTTYIYPSGDYYYFRNEKGNTTYIYPSGNYFYFRNEDGNTTYIYGIENIKKNNKENNNIYNNNQYSHNKNLINQTDVSYLNIVNSTDKNVYFCYVSYDAYNGWQAVGWFQVNSNSNITVNLGNYAGNNVYLYAEYNSGELYWGDSNSRFSFCIDKSNAFSIPNSDSKSCTESNYKRVQMYEMRVNAGVNYWSLGN